MYRRLFPPAGAKRIGTIFKNIFPLYALSVTTYIFIAGKWGIDTMAGFVSWSSQNFDVLTKAQRDTADYCAPIFSVFPSSGGQEPQRNVQLEEHNGKFGF